MNNKGFVFLLSVSSSRPAAAAAAPAPTATFVAGSDPMDFNPNRPVFADSRKQKEQDLKKALSSRMEANLSKVANDSDNGVDDQEWDEN